MKFMNTGTKVTISLIILVVIVGVLIGIGDELLPQLSQVDKAPQTNSPQTIPDQGDYTPMKESIEQALEEAGQATP